MGTLSLSRWSRNLHWAWVSSLRNLTTKAGGVLSQLTTHAAQCGYLMGCMNRSMVGMGKTCSHHYPIASPVSYKLVRDCEGFLFQKFSSITLAHPQSTDCPLLKNFIIFRMLFDEFHTSLTPALGVSTQSCTLLTYGPTHGKLLFRFIFSWSHD